jgi:hypothetical protein
LQEINDVDVKRVAYAMSEAEGNDSEKNHPGLGYPFWMSKREAARAFIAAFRECVRLFP